MTWEILSTQVDNNPLRAIGIIAFGVVVVGGLFWAAWDYERHPEQMEKYKKGNK